MSDLTHIGPDGRARMVDVGAKAVTERVAIAHGRVRMQAETLELAGIIDYLHVPIHSSRIKAFERLPW